MKDVYIFCVEFKSTLRTILLVENSAALDFYTNFQVSSFGSDQNQIAVFRP